ncbi:ribonuclease VapC [Verrucomicrobiota bacterium]|nr:ribonuclease VapC [Verrucomicrobiota bacterium]
MFAVLDTNHFSEMARHSVRGASLERRLSASGAQVFTTIVTPQEAFEGWFTLINRQSAGREQIRAYAQFQHCITLLMKLTILPFDGEAAEHFHRLQSERVRIGTMDLKIAAICLAHDATLLTRNLVDFEKVPGLRAENWLD